MDPLSDSERAQRAAVQALLDFVNLGKVTDADAVYRLFFHVEAPEVAVRQQGGAWVALVPLRLKESGAAAADILETDRAEAQVLLEEFAQSPARARRERATTISELLAKGLLVARPVFDGRRHVERQAFITTGVEASYGYGLSLLFDVGRPYGNRLRRCALDDCRKFFISEARGAGGPLPRYCCEEHQVAADKVRAVFRAQRARNEAKKSKKVKS